MSFARVVDSLERHITAFKKGLTDEDHLAAVAWNANALMHYEAMIERGLLPSELDDMPDYEGQAIADKMAEEAWAEQVTAALIDCGHRKRVSEEEVSVASCPEDLYTDIAFDSTFKFQNH